MSEEGNFSSASRHDSRAGLPGSGGGKDGPPPPFTPAASSPLDDVTRTSAGEKRTLSPGREVARSPPIMGPSPPAHLDSGVGRRRSPTRRRRREDGQETPRRRREVGKSTRRRRRDDEETSSSRPTTMKRRPGDDYTSSKETSPHLKTVRGRYDDDEATLQRRGRDEEATP